MTYFEGSERQLFAQYIEAEYGEELLKKMGINDIKRLVMEYEEWKIKRQFIDPVLLNMLENDGFFTDSTYFAEVQKGSEDSIFNNPLVDNKCSKVITPYSKIGFKDDLKDRIITCDQRLVYVPSDSSLPHITNINGERECLKDSISTYLLVNPYDVHYPDFKYGYLPVIHGNHAANVILGVTGFVSDQDYEKKISMIESLIPIFKAFGKGSSYITPYIVNSAQEKDAYYMYIATNPKVNVKKLSRQR